MLKPQIICNLSGVAATEDESTNTDIPEGWVQIKVSRCFSNPKWEAIQDVKQNLIQQTLLQVPEDQRDVQLANIVIQVEAQYALLESQTQEFITEEEIVYFAPPESDLQLFEEYNKIRESIGLEKDEIEEEEEEEEEVTKEVKSPEPESLKQEAEAEKEEKTSAK